MIVQAPTGSGKTYIFELFYPDLREQAVFTVPTRALANDKPAEWQALRERELIAADPPSLKLRRGRGTAASTTYPPEFMHHKRLMIKTIY